MANIKSNEKSIRKNEKRRLRNTALKSSIKTAIKKAEETKNKDDINNATKLIDKALKNNTLHKNRVNKLKSKVQSIPTSK